MKLRQHARKIKQALSETTELTLKMDIGLLDEYNRLAQRTGRRVEDLLKRAVKDRLKHPRVYEDQST